jgi:multidrug efflux pump subunit AcrB
VWVRCAICSFDQALDYPAIQVDVDRQMAGQLGITVDDVGRSFAAATSSSRFVAPNYWADPRTGIAFQVQGGGAAGADDDARGSACGAGLDSQRGTGTARRCGADRKTRRSLANTTASTVKRMVTMTANVAGEDLGRATSRINEAIRRAGAPPRGTSVAVRGQIAAMQRRSQHHRWTARGRRRHLPAAGRELPVAPPRFVVVSHVPAVLAGVAAMLWLTGTTLNVQSFMGAIMAIGVAVANAILLVTFAEHARRHGGSPRRTAIDARAARMRPVLMTSAAMIAGMIPMALALGEGAEATAPLGRAVIGGLSMATLATLIVLPSVYSLLQQSAHATSASLDPDDPESQYRT